MEKLVLKDAFLTTKKTFFYNFFPTKLEEDHCRATNRPHQVTKSVIEIRDAFPPPQPDPANPWRIRRTLTFGEVTNGQIFLSCNEVFDHVFRYWSLEVTKIAVMGMNKLCVVIWDFTEESKPVCGGKSFFEKGCDEEGYNLGILDLVKGRSLNANDEIGLYWDVKFSGFVFKVWGRSSGQTAN
ncbi:hypothetical protein QQ045_026693 [Rhodiola kirilowii]